MVVLQVGACGCGFFLAEACQRVFDPILLSCAKKSGVEPPRRSCGESCCAAAQLNKRAAALLKILGVSTICTDEKRKCLRLRRHSLAVLRLRWISVRLQRSDCRAANLWCRPPRRSLSSARASAVRVRRMRDAPLKGSPCGKGPIPPIRGEMSRRDKEGRDAGAVRRLRGLSAGRPTQSVILTACCTIPQSASLPSSLYTKEPLVVRCIIPLCLKRRGLRGRAREVGQRIPRS